MSFERKTVIEQLVDFCTSTSLIDYPESVKKDLVLRMIDIVGICTAASATRPFADQLLKYASGNTSVVEEGSSIVGSCLKAQPEMAAFINGGFGHCLDYDDTHVGPVTHPSSVLFPTAFAISEERNPSIPLFVEALLSGFVTMLVIGKLTLSKDEHKSQLTSRGVHPTSAIGVFGSAMVASKLLSLTKEQTISALGIASSFASGLLQGNKTGDSVKRIHSGWSAMSGITAARLSSVGITGPAIALEGELGFLRVFCDMESGAKWEWGKREVFEEFSNLTFKPYPTNVYIHGAIDAMVDIIKTCPFERNEIQKISVGLSATQKQIVFDPQEVKKRPPNSYSAQFSLPFALSSMIVRKDPSLKLQDFNEEAISLPEMHEVMDKIDCYVHPECEKFFPTSFPAIVEVFLTSGESIKREVYVNEGMPSKPLTPSKIKEKFIDNVLGIFSIERSHRTLEVIENLYHFTHFNDISSHLFDVDKGK